MYFASMNVCVVLTVFVWYVFIVRTVLGCPWNLALETFCWFSLKCKVEKWIERSDCDEDYLQHLKMYLFFSKPNTFFLLFELFFIHRLLILALYFIFSIKQIENCILLCILFLFQSKVSSSHALFNPNGLSGL